MKKFFPFCLLFCLICLSPMHAQQYPREKLPSFDQIVEQLLPISQEDAAYEALYESLLQLYTHPIDLNHTDAESLRALHLLSESQIQSFFRHLERNGKLLSIYELQAVPGWSLETIYSILPFVSLRKSGWRKGNQPLPERISRSAQKMLLLRFQRVLEKRAGYLPLNDSTPPSYIGSPNKLHARFRLHHPGDFSFGFSLEKDAGEQLIWNPPLRQYGADFYSFHGILYDQGKWKKIAIGDYQLQYGQSLVFGAGFRFGKGAESVAGIRRSNIGIRPYTSVIESGFFRGAAFTYQLLPTLEISSFYSNAARDALLEETLGPFANEFEESFSSLQQSGFHRTRNELAGKHSSREQSAGAVIHYKGLQRRLQFGGTFLFSRFHHPWKPKPQLYKLFEFQGQQNYTASLFGEYNWQNAQIFAEVARSQSGGKGLVGGILAALHPSLDFSFLYRKYDRDFHSFYGTAFSEGTRPINESGLYWGLKYQPDRKFFISAYFDRFYFPWLRYRVDAPSAGWEYQLRAQYQIKRKWQLYGQFRQQLKSINLTEGLRTALPLPGSKRNFLLNLDYTGHKAISFRTRVQWSHYLYNKNRTKGFALAQDLNWQGKRWKLSSRIALFQTDDYENRQYIYEKDVLWAFSIPALYGRGVRNYLLAQYKFNQHITLWLRWARTRYTDREHISSGTEKIEGPVINQLKAQLRWMF